MRAQASVPSKLFVIFYSINSFNINWLMTSCFFLLISQSYIQTSNIVFREIRSGAIPEYDIKHACANMRKNFLLILLP